MPLTEEELAPYRKLLGLTAEELTPDNAAVMLSRAVETALGAADKVQKVADAAETARVAAEARAAEADRREAVALSRTATAEPRTPSAAELHYAAKAVKAAKAEAIRSRAITPAVADAAEARLIGKAVDLGGIALSRPVEADDHKLAEGFGRLLDFYEVVAGNVTPPATGEQSGPQVGVPLGRPDHDAPGTTPKATPVNPYQSTIDALTPPKS